VAIDQDNPSILQTRRTFCTHACQAASLLALGSVLEGCGGSPTSPSGESSAPALTVVSAAVANGVATVTIGAGSPLASAGGAALVQTVSGNFLVSRTGQSGFTALTAVCTHQNCTITGFQGQDYVCPCHGSQYSTSGSVVSGPATRALRQFATQFANDVLTISL
jgi:cytochrome b6-f complex iron-sulfur subunit